MRRKGKQSEQKATRKDPAIGVKRSDKYNQRYEGKQASKAQKPDEIHKAQRKTPEKMKVGPVKQTPGSVGILLGLLTGQLAETYTLNGSSLLLTCLSHLKGHIHFK